MTRIISIITCFIITMSLIPPEGESYGSCGCEHEIEMECYVILPYNTGERTDVVKTQAGSHDEIKTRGTHRAASFIGSFPIYDLPARILHCVFRE